MIPKDLDDNFLEQVLRKLDFESHCPRSAACQQGGSHEQSRDWSHLGHSNHGKIDFKISVDMSKSVGKTPALDIRKADFRLLRESASWEEVSAGLGICKLCSVFKHHLLSAQGQEISKS